jgi:hypothetical protein
VHIIGPEMSSFNRESKSSHPGWKQLLFPTCIQKKKKKEKKNKKKKKEVQKENKGKKNEA